jgi:hypothetical protein
MFLLLVSGLLVPAFARAQGSEPTATTTENAPVFASASGQQEPLRIARQGSVLLLLDAQGEWCRVEYQDPELGRRTGYVQRKFVRIDRPSVSSPISRQASSAGLGAQQDRIARGAGQDTEHAWVNVDFARYTTLADAATFTFAKPMYGEVAAVSAAYPKFGGVNDVAISGGFTAVGPLGVAIGFDGQDYSSPVGLGAAIPSPYFYNIHGIAGSVTASPLTRKDRAIDLSAVYSIPLGRSARLRVSGGPTYFHVDADMVSAIGYDQAASALIPVNVVAISSYLHQPVTGSAWGFNAGADLSVFFSRHFGVGGIVGINRGAVTIPEPLSANNAELTTGHVEIGGGLRVRF